jgi:hypothetical protein
MAGQIELEPLKHEPQRGNIERWEDEGGRIVKTDH